MELDDEDLAHRDGLLDSANTAQPVNPEPVNPEPVSSTLPADLQPANPLPVTSENITLSNSGNADTLPPLPPPNFRMPQKRPVTSSTDQEFFDPLSDNFAALTVSSRASSPGFPPAQSVNFPELEGVRQLNEVMRELREHATGLDASMVTALEVS